MFYRLLTLVICIIFSFCSAGFSFQKEDVEKADFLLFKTKRTPKELEEALTLLEKSYTDIKTLKDFSKNNKEYIKILLRYSYALYYKAAYMFPREDEPNGKQYIDTRLDYYSKAEKITEELLKLSLTDRSIAAEALFTAGMVKGEIASLKSSAFAIVKGKNLLEEALKKDPKIQNGAIYLGLGRMYGKTPRILFGNQAKALQYLQMAIDNFEFPNIVAFYFIGDTILDKRDFKTVPKDDKYKILNNFKLALEWANKRKNISPTKPHSLVPEELDSLQIIVSTLNQWGIKPDPVSVQKSMNTL